MDKENNYAPRQKRRCMRVAGDTLANLSNLSKLIHPSHDWSRDLDPVIGEVNISQVKMVVNALNYERALDKEWRLLMPSISLQFPVILNLILPAPAQLVVSNIKKSEVIVADNGKDSDIPISMTIEVQQYLTKGSFGHIYLGHASNTEPRDWIEKKVVIKVDKNITSVVWECYIHTLLKHRSSKSGSTMYSNHYLEPICLILYSNASVMCMEYAVYGTLHDTIIVLSKQQLSGKDHELICLHFANDMMKVLAHLHRHKIIHTDIKTNNWVVKQNAETNKLTLVLIDFGKAKDTQVTGDQANILYTGSSSASGFKCPAMLEGSTWSFEADYYSALVCIHQSLYFQPMSTITRVSIDEVRRFGYSSELRALGPYIIPTSAIKRYWIRDLWSATYYILLNESYVPSSIKDLSTILEANISPNEALIADALRIFTNYLHKI